MGSSRHAYSLIKVLRKRLVPLLNMIPNKDRKILQSIEEVQNRWTQYCSDLFKDHGGRDMMVKELEEITPLSSNEELPGMLYSEIPKAMRILERNKSPGSDRINAEAL